MYDILSWLGRLRLGKKRVELERACIFDENVGCGILAHIPTENLGTTFDFQAMALNCGYRGGKDNWWHIHFSGPARSGSFARNCPHSYEPGHPEQAQPCKCFSRYPTPAAQNE